MKKATASPLFRPAYSPVFLPRPLVLQAIPAGFPSPMDGTVEKQLDLNEHFIQHAAATFYMRVSGDSMSGAGILDGDILIVDRSLEPIHNSIVIAIVDNEFTVKRLYRKNNTVELRPENPDYPALTISDETELVIWGVVSGVTRKV